MTTSPFAGIRAMRLERDGTISIALTDVRDTRSSIRKSQLSARAGPAVQVPRDWWHSRNALSSGHVRSGRNLVAGYAGLSAYRTGHYSLKCTGYPLK